MRLGIGKGSTIPSAVGQWATSPVHHCTRLGTGGRWLVAGPEGWEEGEEDGAESRWRGD